MSATERFLVVLQDTNGCRRFVGGDYDFDSHAAAQNRIDAIRGRQHKAHKVSYEIFPYLHGHKEVTILEHRITC